MYVPVYRLYRRLGVMTNIWAIFSFNSTAFTNISESKLPNARTVTFLLRWMILTMLFSQSIHGLCLARHLFIGMLSSYSRVVCNPEQIRVWSNANCNSVPSVIHILCGLICKADTLYDADFVRIWALFQKKSDRWLMSAPVSMSIKLRYLSTNLQMPRSPLHES